MIQSSECAIEHVQRLLDPKKGAGSYFVPTFYELDEHSGIYWFVVLNHA